MGVDLSSIRPQTPEAKEGYHRNWWGWRPLWEFCREAVPEVAGRVKYYGSNDGDGLVEVAAIELADGLQLALDTDNPSLSTFDPGKGRDYPPPDRQEVEQFIVFLRTCGGFEIY